jgi:hypothetical protein
LYDVPWSLGPLKPVEVEVEIEPIGPRPAEGRYLTCARMLVDPIPDGLRATTDGAAAIVGQFTGETEHWTMTLPDAIVDERRKGEVEDLLSLVLTTGWRRSGWVPLHAAGLVAPDAALLPGPPPGVIVVAASGGGKTTLTVAMVRQGWRSLGDDKLLLGDLGQGTLVAAVKHMLNIDPAAAAWFPELWTIRAEPAYSAWTPKRRVSLGRMWSHAPAATMKPTHLVVVSRIAGPGGVDVTPMTAADSLSALLRQTVIPRDPTLARPITVNIVGLAQAVTGLRFAIHDDAFARPGALDAAIEKITCP